ncbi:MAG: DUF4331 family protein [Kofleriaceae bacterium]
MKLKSLFVAAGLLAGATALGTTYQIANASDHDDGELDLKSRALNLTDHYAFKSGTDLSLVMYVNPRSLPQRQYDLSTNARYEFHVSKVADKTAQPTATEDYVFRFEAGPPNAAGVQSITLTVIRNGTVIGTHTGMSTDFASSKANTVTSNSGTAADVDFKYFVGMRADSFTFDVQRFFTVRSFLARRFFGGAGGIGDPTALQALAPTCAGQTLAQGILGTGDTTDGDAVNLWNPPRCAPDFTKNYNVTAIVLNVPIADLGGGTVFDTWSTISVKQ